jgi:hypothetical protein
MLTKDVDHHSKECFNYYVQAVNAAMSKVWEKFLMDYQQGKTVYHWHCPYCSYTTTSLDYDSPICDKCGGATVFKCYYTRFEDNITIDWDADLAHQAETSKDNKCSCPMDSLGKPLIDGKCRHCGGV